VTSVGGTSLAIGKNKNYEFETGWGTELDPLASSGQWAFNPPGTVARLQFWYDGSSGGGVSTAYTQPSYQKGVVPAALARDVPQGKATGPMRVVPDVSALADPSTGMLVGETLYGTDKQPHKIAFYLSRIGGTSVASPIFSGIEADASQAAGHPLGFANPLIYSLDKANKTTRAFNDVTDKPFGSRKLAELARLLHSGGQVRELGQALAGRLTRPSRQPRAWRFAIRPNGGMVPAPARSHRKR
jgi:subtilase family serine protease